MKLHQAIKEYSGSIFQKETFLNSKEKKETFESPFKNKTFYIVF
jgi:hypothetical protein